MNMKNNLINWKFVLLQIIYSMICIILIRQFMNFNAIPYNDLKKRNSKTIITPAPYVMSNSTNVPGSNRTLTLSRGSIDDFTKSPIKKIESYSYEEDLYTLNEAALIDSYYIKKANISSSSIIASERQVLNTHLPDYLMYKNVNVTSLNGFLKSKNSLLAEEPYFSTILSVCKDFNLNPLVIFAITGQEQSFVPKSNKYAYKIANNPFNVFSSWKKYNTSIQDTTKIAARTVVNLCKNKPNNVDAFTWINRKYSSDQNWSKAVRSIFNQLEDNVSYWK